ncbi:MAG: SRPBCC family protein [Pseudomonadales bacterium]|nr:SRPBCC family protein [Pseudomonadales bacterium]
MFKVAFNLERSIVINKPVAEVFTIVSNFKTWPTWSPWLIQEPNCFVSVTNNATTVGHNQSWQGQNIGSGNMSISQIQANTQIDYDLNFLKPWKSQSQTSFKFKEIDGNTHITWSMKSTLPLFLFWMKNMMIALIGNDYVRGLSMLKDLCETGNVNSKLDTEKSTTKAEFYYVGIKRECVVTKIGELMQQDFKTLHNLIKDNTLKQPENVFAIYEKFDLVKGRCQFVSALTYNTQINLNDSQLITGLIPSHKSCIVTHTGEYKHLGNAWATGMGYLRGNKIKQSKQIFPYEIYVSDPEKTEAKDLITEVNFPLK